MGTRFVAFLYMALMVCLTLLGAELDRLLGDKQANDKTEQAKDRTEDLDDQDLDESIGTHGQSGAH